MERRSLGGGQPSRGIRAATTWEVRIQAKHRLFYCVYRVQEGDNEQKTVEILRAIIKERETTAEALRRKR
jgi:hypothetical protein